MKDVAKDARRGKADAYPITLACHTNGDGPMWVATVQELPGCEAQGGTPESAAAGVREAIERWMATAEAEGREVPPPGAAAAHSGRLLVRMPRSLHGELVSASEREGTSLNAYIVAALSASVAWRRSRQPDAPPENDEAAAAGPRTRGLSLALTANLVVLAIAAVIAVALLITAWLG